MGKGRHIPSLWKITNQDIEHLNDKQLTEMLNKLLHLEAEKYHIPLSSIDVPLNITTSDGGIDGEIRWDGEPTFTNYLKRRITGFQCKATKMGPKGCGDELLDENAKQLKPQINDLLDSCGCYILFYKYSLSGKGIKERIKSMKNALIESGFQLKDSSQIEVYDANKISNWANNYIQAVTLVHFFLQRQLPDSVQTWDSWSDYRENNTIQFVSDEKTESQISLLREHFKGQLYGKRMIARIDGLSGLGKTRLAFETFRPHVDRVQNPDQQELSDSVIYIQAAEDDSRIIDMVCNWRNSNYSGILVVDDCCFALHKKLQREVENVQSHFSLLTLDYEPSDDLNTSGTCFVHLGQTSKEVIEKIIKQSYPSLDDSTINRIYDFAQGFPQMAVLLAEARLNGIDNLGRLTDSQLVEKLLWGRKQIDTNARKVISGCSIFKYFGIEGRLANQLDYISNNICRMDKDDCYEILMEFIKRGIIDKRGDLARVVPPPLAVQLAADWWSKCSTERAKSVLKNIPDDLKNQICQQMVAMSADVKIINLVEDLCGEFQPFGQAEVLMSRQGSDLFRYLTQVNPEATLSALERVFGGLSKDELMKGTAYRRNIVWSLENLCYWDNIFTRSARLLAKFAEAENETWGNNATNQFLQLFHVYLSGTQAHPSKRMALIDEILKTRSFELHILAIKALGSVLESNHFMRSGGVESQGARFPSSDWKPQKWFEIYDYSRDALSRLTDIACHGDSKLASLARHEIAMSIRTLVRYGLMDELESSLASIQEKDSSFWQEGLESIRQTIEFDGERIPAQGLNQLKKLQRALEPRDMQARLIDIVIDTKFRSRHLKSGEIDVDLGEEAARKLGEEVADDEQFLELIPLLFKGDQMHSFQFGMSVGEKTSNPAVILEAASRVVHEGDQENFNMAFLGGFLRSVRLKDERLVKRFLTGIVSDEKLIPYFIDLISMIGVTKADLDVLQSLTNQEKISEEKLRRLEYGRGLSDTEPKLVVSFFENIPKRNHGSWTSFLLMFTYLMKEKKLLGEYGPTLKRKIMECDVNQMDIRFIEMDLFHFGESFKEIDPEGKDTELMEHAIASSIKLMSMDIRSSNQYYETQEILEHYLVNNPKPAWNLVGEVLLSGSGVKYSLMNVLGSDLSHKIPLISRIPSDILEDWWTSHSEMGALIIANIIDPVEKKDGKIFVSPIAKKLLETSNEEILERLINNSSGGAWVGKFSDQTREKIQLLNAIKSQTSSNLGASVDRFIEYYEKRLRAEIKHESEESLRYLP